MRIGYAMAGHPSEDPMNTFFHVSEEPDIERFEPRPSPYVDEPVVWAIGEERLHNYLLPRECPRVTCFASPGDGPEIRKIMAGSPALVAIEQSWFERAHRVRLYVYRLPGETFEVIDEGAGYAVSREAVSPEAVDVIDDALGAIVSRGVELRVVPNLWPLRDAILDVTPNFSFIRMRDAQPRAEVSDAR